MQRLLLSLIALLICALPATSNWGAGGCEPVGSVENVYQWQRSTQDGEFYLYLGGVEIGALRVRDRVYFALTSEGEWQAAVCPCELPKGVCQCPDGCSCPPDNCNCDPKDCKCRKSTVSGLPPTGVVRDKVERGKHTINGRACSKAELIAEVKKAAIPADQNKLRLTVIGPADQTNKVLADLKGIPETEAFAVQAYTPDHWAVKDNGLADGKPFSIVVQTPDGTPLHRQWDYEGGISALQEALRTARAGYAATKDPDLRKPDLFSLVLKKLEEVPLNVWLILIVGVVVYVILKKKEAV